MNNTNNVTNFPVSTDTAPLPEPLADLEITCKSCKWAGFTEEINIVPEGLEWISTCPNCGSTKLEAL